jgi:hypothetical protein
MRTLSMTFSVFAGFLSFLPEAFALVINGENAAENYRFETGSYPGSPVPNTSGSFIASGYDLSGVGWGTNSTRSYVMISDQYFLYATHYPPTDTNMYFYSDAEDGVVLYTIDTSFNLNIPAYNPDSAKYLEYPYAATGNHLKSDISVGRLLTPIDPSDGIASYPILDLPSAADYIGLDLLVYGWSAAVGTGVIDGLGALDLYNANGTPGLASDDYVNSPDGLADTLVMIFTQGVGDGEARLEGGDSGSPSFALWNGSLALVGIHSAVDGSTNYDAFLPAYLDSLSSGGVTFSTVPEPTALWLLGGIGFTWVAARRSRSR